MKKRVFSLKKVTSFAKKIFRHFFPSEKTSLCLGKTRGYSSRKWSGRNSLPYIRWYSYARQWYQRRKDRIDCRLWWRTQNPPRCIACSQQPGWNDDCFQTWWFSCKKGDKIAGTRIIPLVIEKSKMDKAEKVAEQNRFFPSFRTVLKKLESLRPEAKYKKDWSKILSLQSWKKNLTNSHVRFWGRHCLGMSAARLPQIFWAL